MSKNAELVRLRQQVGHLQRLLKTAHDFLHLQEQQLLKTEAEKAQLEQRLKTNREGVYTLLAQHVALKEAVTTAGFDIHYGGHALPGEKE